MNTSLTGKKIHSLDGSEVEAVNSAATGLSVSITSEELARQFRAATDPLTKQLEKLCDLMRELRRDTVRRDQDTSAPAQGPLGPRGDMYDTILKIPKTQLEVMKDRYGGLDQTSLLLFQFFNFV